MPSCLHTGRHFQDYLRGGKVDETTFDRRPQQLLFEACARGSIRLVRELTDEYPDLADITADDNRALICAAAGGHLRLLRYLVEHLPKCSARQLDTSAREFEAFISASRNGHLNIVRYLVEKAPRFSQTTPDRNSFEIALQNASRNDRRAVASYLLNKAAPILGIAEIQADTAFYLAVINQHIGILRCLAESSTPVKLNRTQTDSTIRTFFAQQSSRLFNGENDRLYGKRLAMADYLLHEFTFASGHVPDLQETSLFPAGTCNYLNTKRLMLASLSCMKKLGIPNSEWRSLLNGYRTAVV
jgi:hypothetical protein